MKHLDDFSVCGVSCSGLSVMLRLAGQQIVSLSPPWMLPAAVTIKELLMDIVEGGKIAIFVGQLA